MEGRIGIRKLISRNLYAIIIQEQARLISRAISEGHRHYKQPSFLDACDSIARRLENAK